MTEQVQQQERDPSCGACGCPYPGGNCWTTFQKENERLREALKPFAREAQNYDDDVPDDLHLTVRDEDGVTTNTMIAVSDLRRAAHLLGTV